MQSSSIKSIRKISSQRFYELGANKKIKRIFHIKSLPAYEHESVRKTSTSKVEGIPKEQPQVKLRRFKTQQHLKPPIFGAVKTARERNMQLAKKKQHPSQPSHISKSLTKSTNFKSPNHQEKEGKSLKGQRMKAKKSGKKILSGVLRRVKQVMEEYQIKIQKCIEEKDLVLKENDRLRNQIQNMQRRTKRSEK